MKQLKLCHLSLEIMELNRKTVENCVFRHKNLKIDMKTDQKLSFTEEFLPFNEKTKELIE